MKRHRFITSMILPPSGEWVAIVDEAIVYQLQRVLRARPGAEILLFNDHQEAVIVVDEVTTDRVTGQVRQVEQRQDTFLPTVLYCAILKKDNFDWVVQKATEVGVQRIVPLMTERVVKQHVRVDRLDRVAREATEQCGRMTVPVISEPQSVVGVVQRLKAERRYGWWLTRTGGVVREAKADSQELALFVGPEGGWSPEEEQLIGMTLMPVTLGATTLRAETAATIGSYVAVNRVVTE